VIAFGLIWFADLTALGGTTSLLLLCVFTVVNIAVLVLRRDEVQHKHFKAPTAIPAIGAVACAYLASPLSGRSGDDYRVAGVLLVIGIALWLVHFAATRITQGN
jgi:APA family basic amino acid/polyamine antiporter